MYLFLFVGSCHASNSIYQDEILTHVASLRHVAKWEYQKHECQLASDVLRADLCVLL